MKKFVFLPLLLLIFTVACQQENVQPETVAEGISPTLASTYVAYVGIVNEGITVTTDTIPLTTTAAYWTQQKDGTMVPDIDKMRTLLNVPATISFRGQEYPSTLVVGPANSLGSQGEPEIAPGTSVESAISCGSGWMGAALACSGVDCYEWSVYASCTDPECFLCIVYNIFTGNIYYIHCTSNQ